MSCVGGTFSEAGPAHAPGGRLRTCHVAVNIYDGPDQAAQGRTEREVLVDDLGETINVLLTGRRVPTEERVRLVGSLLDMAEWAGLRSSE